MECYICSDEKAEPLRRSKNCDSRCKLVWHKSCMEELFVEMPKRNVNRTVCDLCKKPYSIKKSYKLDPICCRFL